MKRSYGLIVNFAWVCRKRARAAVVKDAVTVGGLVARRLLTMERRLRSTGYERIDHQIPVATYISRVSKVIVSDGRTHGPVQDGRWMGEGQYAVQP